MAIEKTYLLGKNITLGCGFDLQAKAPLDSRQVVPEYDGLQALIDGNAAYEGMIVYDEGTKKTYQAQLVDGVLAFREFGINESELKALIASETTAAMEFKGVTATLPENPDNGDMYKVGKVGDTDPAIIIDGVTAQVGDAVVAKVVVNEDKTISTTWYLIPSGDDLDDTWRIITGVDNSADLTFIDGDMTEAVVTTDGKVKYNHVKFEKKPEDTTTEADLVDENDKRIRTYITKVETDDYGHITGYKTATENVEDTNTEYTFEGQSDEATSVYFQVTSNEEGAAAEVVYLDAYSKNEADKKITDAIDAVKVEVANQDAVVLAEAQKYADTHANVIESVKVNGTALTPDANKAVDITIPESTKVEASGGNGNIKVDGQEVTVYEHPESHTASEISDFATEVAKVKVNEATKAAQDGNGKVIADTYAEKATTLEGYSIADAYTKTEIDNLFTWGSF